MPHFTKISTILPYFSSSPEPPEVHPRKLNITDSINDLGWKVWQFTIKGIKFQFYVREGNLDLLLKRNSKAINLFIEKIFLYRANSLSKLNKFREEICNKTKLANYASGIAVRNALAIYRSWKRNKGKKIPHVKSKFVQLQPNYNCKLFGNKLRVTFEKRKYVWIELKSGKYQDMILELVKRNELKLGQIAVGKEFVVLSVKKEYLPYEYDGMLALDINEKSVDGIVMKDGELRSIKWDINRICESNQRYFGYRRSLQKKYPNRFNIWRKSNSGKNYSRRTRWYLDNYSKGIVEFAQNEKLMIVMEDLRNIKKGINKRKLKRNKYNSRKQMMRTKSLSLLGRLNRTNFRKMQFMIDYKGRWNNVPIRYVDPKNTSRTCSRCGCINGNLKEKRVLKCEKCGFEVNRDMNAAINILKLGMAPCGSGSRLPKIEDLANQISEANLDVKIS